MATIKQKRAFAKILENGGKVSKAMREVGYTTATAHTPHKLTERSVRVRVVLGDLCCTHQNTSESPAN